MWPLSLDRSLSAPQNWSTWLDRVQATAQAPILPGRISCAACSPLRGHIFVFTPNAESISITASSGQDKNGRKPALCGHRREMRRDSSLRDCVFLKARVRMARRHFIENGGAPFRNLVDVVLFPLHRGAGLDDYALARELLELFDEHGLARLQGFGDFRMDAQGQAGSLQVSGHLARFGLYFVTYRRYGLHHTRTRAVGPGLSKRPLERL